MADATLYRLYAPHELGDDGYPPIWHTLLKHDVREQAGHRCVRCGHPYRNGEHGTGEWSPCDIACGHRHRGPLRVFLSGEWVEVDDSTPMLWMKEGEPCVAGKPPVLVEARWRILTVHHLDGDKANCRWWNLAALCQRCHLEIQGRVRMEHVYPFEHSPWFQPYAAGYYAHAYLGEDLSRDEVDARLDELLALERVA